MPVARRPLLLAGTAALAGGVRSAQDDPQAAQRAMYQRHDGGAHEAFVVA